MSLPVISLSKLISLAAKKTGRGTGSTLPGHIALKLDSQITEKLLKKNPQLKIILVAGTNGKTTTSTLLTYILEKNNLRVIQNNTGANSLNGIVSTLILNAKPNGKIPYDVAIFEVDENSLPIVLSHLKPTAIILLNLFRDQLDRYGEVNTISFKWKQALDQISSRSVLERDQTSALPQLFINGDDPGLRLITEDSKSEIHYFGIDEKLMSKKELSHDVDFVYCPKCQTKLSFEKIAYSHLGKYECPKCKLTNPEVKFPNVNKYPLQGTYNIYNTNAALLALQTLFEFSDKQLNQDLENFKPAFGRQEVIEYKNRNIMVLLSKNPAGFNRSLEVVNEFGQKEKTVLIVLNDRIPDGRDVSWIWDVDFENLKSTNIVVSGDRTYDMALRIHYIQKSEARDQKLEIEQNLETAIGKAIKLTIPNQTLFILPTYSAMLEARKIITGRKIL